MSKTFIANLRNGAVTKQDDTSSTFVYETGIIDFGSIVRPTDIYIETTCPENLIFSIKSKLSEYYSYSIQDTNPKLNLGKGLRDRFFQLKISGGNSNLTIVELKMKVIPIKSNV